MAKFPIQRSSRQIGAFGANVRARKVPTVSGQPLLEGIVKLGNVGVEVAAELDRTHGETEFSKARLAANERMGRQLSQQLFEEQDPEKYDQIYQSALDEVKTNRPKHWYAGQLYDFYLDNQQPQWNEGMYTTYMQRVVANERELKAREKAIKEAQTEDLLVGIQIDAENLARQNGMPPAEARKKGQDTLSSALADPKFRNRYGIAASDAAAMIRNINEMADVRKAQSERQAEQEKFTTTEKWLMTTEPQPGDMQKLRLEAFQTGMEQRHVEAVIKNWSEKRTESTVEAQSEMDQTINNVGDGTVDVTEAKKLLHDLKGQLTDDDYLDYDQRLNQEFNRSQDVAMSRSYAFAKTQIISVSESMLDQLIGAIKAEPDATKRKGLQDDLESRRAQWRRENLQLHQFDLAMNAWRKDNKNASPDEIDAEALRKLNKDFSPAAQLTKEQTVTIKNKSTGVTRPVPLSLWERNKDQFGDKYEVVP